MTITWKEFRKAQRVLWRMAREAGVGMGEVRKTVQQCIDAAWDRAWAPGNLVEQLRWQKIFPGAQKPSVDEFIVGLARETAAGREPPYLL